MSSTGLRNKLAILADAAKYDASCASSGSKRAGNRQGLGSSDGTGICHSYTPDGRCISLLKILLTNHCVYDCQYCVNRVTSDVPRARFRPEEVVALTLDFYRRNYIEGLFLSSGVIQSPDYTMEQLAAVARTLRQEHGFNGYIHLKAVPGAAPELLAEAGRWADRLSANVELPTPADLAQLAPEKSRPEIETAMTEIRSGIDQSKAERKESPKAPKFAPAGQSTQMIVGATASPDAAILGTAADLYKRHSLRRVYYTAFSPFPKADPRLPVQAAPLLREHRLYQADWLIRFYGFDVGELLTSDQPNLETSRDPKLSWALRHRESFPVDVNTAPRSQLLRVPGFGVRNVDRIVRIRKHRRLRLEDLAKLRVALKRARPFIVTADHNPDVFRLDRTDLFSDLDSRITAPVPPEVRIRPRQLDLFASAQESALSGEL